MFWAPRSARGLRFAQNESVYSKILLTDLHACGILVLDVFHQVTTVNDDLRNTILDVFEASLAAQLRAVRRLRPAPGEPLPAPLPKRLSQVDMSYDILRRARSPLHISDLLARIHAAFAVAVDRESLVSSLTKKVARRDRFTRTAKNTFGLLPEVN